MPKFFEKKLQIILMDCRYKRNICQIIHKFHNKLQNVYNLQWDPSSPTLPFPFLPLRESHRYGLKRIR